jgi:hypothetical protein
MMEYVQGFNSTILATLTQNATMACIATRVADVSSIRKWGRGALQTRPVEGNLCVSSKPPSQHMACARKSSLCLKILSSSRCIRLIWPTPTRDCSYINKISKKFAAPATSTRHLVAASPGLNPRIRAVCACPTWIAPLLTLLFLLNVNAVTHPREQNIVI